MPEVDERDAPARAKVFVVDPASMTVLWSSEPVTGEDAAESMSLDLVIPLAESLGVPAAVKSVAETGNPEHLKTNLVSTGKGSMAYVMSLYRLPDGRVLLVSENTWIPAAVKPSGGSRRRSGRHAR